MDLDGHLHTWLKLYTWLTSTRIVHRCDTWHIESYKRVKKFWRKVQNPEQIMKMPKNPYWKDGENPEKTNKTLNVWLNPKQHYYNSENPEASFENHKKPWKSWKKIFNLLKRQNLRCWWFLTVPLDILIMILMSWIIMICDSWLACTISAL